MKLDEHEIKVLNNSVGSIVSNHKEEEVGFIAGVFNTSKQGNTEYIILGADHLFGSSTRYFAIPACSEMILVTGENFTFKIDREDLLQAKRISLTRCPRPPFDLEPLIYELTDFRNSIHHFFSQFPADSYPFN